MLNNKGQSLILFVLVLPILLLLLILVIDIGKIIVLKQELNNISEIVLDYGIDNINKENIEKELEELVNINKKEIDKINVYIEDNKIYIYLTEKSDGVLSSLINLPIFSVKTSFVGYMLGDEKRIERTGD